METSFYVTAKMGSGKAFRNKFSETFFTLIRKKISKDCMLYVYDDDFISFVDILHISSIMSSSDNREKSSSSFYQRSLNRIRHLESVNAEAAQIAHSFQQLKVNSEINTVSTPSITVAASTQTSCLLSESLAEEELIERLKELINEFMTRPGREYSYNTTMRWTVDHGNHINYSVVILIDQPSDLI